MVLGITLRRRKTIDEPQPLQPSPSLPTLTSTGLVSPAGWPAGLIDIKKVQEEIAVEANGDPAVDYPNATYKSNFQSSPGQQVPSFHRPFRPQNLTDAARDGASDDGIPARTSIASIYTAHTPPSAFPRSASVPSTSHQPAVRRLTRVPPRFNIMVAGGAGVGKTSFVKLFLNTCDISPTALESETTDVRRYIDASLKQTRALKPVSVEVCEDRHERLQLTVVDTVGFDFEDGHELELQLGVSSAMKYLDQQFSESMLEESKVIRKNKGDQHIHLCLYLINPDTIMRPSARREKTAARSPAKSQATLTRRGSLSSISSEETSDTSSDDETYGSPEPGEEAQATRTTHEEALDVGGQTMRPAELRVMRRLATRVNILPVIAHADSLTDERLALVRKVVRKDLTEAGIGFGVFDSEDTVGAAQPTGKWSRKSSAASAPRPPLPLISSALSGDDTDEDRSSRPVIKLRSPRQTGRGTERSRSRRRLLILDEDEQEGGSSSPVPNGRPMSPTTAWPAMSKAEVAKMLPFSVMAPDEPPRTRSTKRRPPVPALPNTSEETSGINGTSHHIDASMTTEASSSDLADSTNPLLNSTISNGSPNVQPPRTPRRRPSIKEYRAHIRSREELRDKFTRKYRWGTVDVLNPAHCDFVVLRSAVLGTHMRALRNTTKEVLYENFRTEKLLARRATNKFNEVEREKMLEEL